MTDDLISQTIPTEAQVVDACTWYCLDQGEDFDTRDPDIAESLRERAVQWLAAWQKCLSARPFPPPANRGRVMRLGRNPTRV